MSWWVHLFLKYSDLGQSNSVAITLVLGLQQGLLPYRLELCVMCQGVTSQSLPPILWGAMSSAALLPVWFGEIPRRSGDIKEQLACSGARWQRPAEMMQTAESREPKCDKRGDETPLKSAASVIVRRHREEKRTVTGSQPLMDFATAAFEIKWHRSSPGTESSRYAPGNSHNYHSAHSLSQNKTATGAVITFLYFHWLCSF